MQEGFKINCYQLNRAIKITVAIPNNYNNTSRFYPVIYFLDGQNLYKDCESYSGYSFDLDSTIKKLALEEKEAIYIGIAAANDEARRISEYQNNILANFIISSIHPYLSQRYRMNNYVYCCCSSIASYTGLLLNQSDIFKGIIIFSPIISDDNINNIINNKNNLCYIYSGKNEKENKCLNTVYKLKNILPNACINLDDNSIHNESHWKTKLYDALSYLIL